MKKASIAWWVLCVITGIIGGIVAGAGIWIEMTEQAAIGLYMIVLAPFLLMFAGVCATLGAKFESEGK